MQFLHKWEILLSVHAYGLAFGSSDHACELPTMCVLVLVNKIEVIDDKCISSRVLLFCSHGLARVKILSILYFKWIVHFLQSHPLITKDSVFLLYF